ncbi:MAG: hypothetical protein ACRDQH_06665 [Pseudonocardiaceae bacterium]
MTTEPIEPAFGIPPDEVAPLGAVHHITASFLAGLDPAERTDAEALAQSRQRIAEPGCPPWDELTPDEQATSAVAALHWLRAARSLDPPQPVATGGQHPFHFSVTAQPGGCDWTGEPFTLTVRANSLTEACAKAADIRLPDWTHPDLPDGELAE